MSFFWTEKNIQLYKRAVVNSSYIFDLSNKIISEIGKENTIYDIGCGMSYMSIYLSYFSKEVNCIDIDEVVIKELQAEVDKNNITNINTFTKDYKDFLKEKDSVDCIIASHFLDMEKNLDYLLSKGDYLVIIKNTKKRKGLYDLKKQKIEDVETILQKNNIKYTKFVHNGEFGQPLVSIKEAVEYYNSYSSKKVNEEDMRKLITETKNSEYPYYLPKFKNTGVIIVKKEK